MYRKKGFQENPLTFMKLEYIRFMLLTFSLSQMKNMLGTQGCLSRLLPTIYAAIKVISKRNPAAYKILS